MAKCTKETYLQRQQNPRSENNLKISATSFVCNEPRMVNTILSPIIEMASIETPWKWNALSGRALQLQARPATFPVHREKTGKTRTKNRTYQGNFSYLSLAQNLDRTILHWHTNSACMLSILCCCAVKTVSFTLIKKTQNRFNITISHPFSMFSI